MVRGESKLQPQEEKNQIIRVKGNLDKRTIIRMGISMWSSGYSAVVQTPESFLESSRESKLNQVPKRRETMFLNQH